MFNRFTQALQIIEADYLSYLSMPWKVTVSPATIVTPLIVISV